MTHNKKELFEYINKTCTAMIAPCKDYDTKQALDELAKTVILLDDENWSYFACAPVLHYLTAKKRLPLEIASTQVALVYQSLNWYKNKVFYSFDEELEAEIMRSNLSLTTKVPATLLRRCPYSSFFVQTRGGMIVPEYEEKIHAHPDIVGSGIGFFTTISPFYELDKATGKFKDTGELILNVVAIADNADDTHIINSVSMKIPQVNSEATIDDCAVLLNYDTVYDTEGKN